MTKQAHMNRLWWMASAVVLLFVAAAVVPVAAVEWPSNNKTFIPVNDIRFDNFSDGTYYFNLSIMTTDASAKAIHITDSPTNFPGGVYTKTTVGPDTFYVSDTGGRGGQDDIILMVAINSTNQTDINNFGINITTNGYQWIPQSGGIPDEVDPEADYVNPLNAKPYNSGHYLTGSDIQQDWKFAPQTDYPIYNGQIMSSEQKFKMILIDTKVGTINGTWYNETYTPQALENNGFTKITYEITSNPSSDALIAFNVYAWNEQAAQAPNAVNWINKVLSTSGTAPSGWKVDL
ncbi:MAG: hypothetical protein M0R30_03300 [Methanoregula sp.]|jgi:hypothetical protein|uniref:hypothetical protein n=1 Tax=Methanoregula sp. TaxID=2052170 RepID=UPI0025EAEA2B|nr:hypothetical protein [Methanoregula sp.]MCK9630648.1 hypothetical protein [Methanoregula sp.]